MPITGETFYFKRNTSSILGRTGGALCYLGAESTSSNYQKMDIVIGKYMGTLKSAQFNYLYVFYTLKSHTPYCRLNITLKTKECKKSNQ